MLNSMLGQYRRTIILVVVFLLIAILEVLEVRTTIYGNSLPFFEWMKNSSWLGIIGTTYGSVYATIEAVHLLSMAVIGGTVLATDLRLLGVVLTDIPSETLTRGTHKVFRNALICAIATGIFCAAGVADKVYYMPVFWVKMLALVAGGCFVFLVKQPLLNSMPHSEINPWTIRLLATTSILVWFTVAAAGRWIGFS
ncbi:MAG: hypothetical protein COA96_04675 [SAR86 cluster bacterium]|uniref:DUF6644 domain-containing protein n=1 Tax=SAR86 cluster bacterium TaxID=2030880 RepID=A0A2A5B4X7_9GAMM|nr:MAG: hypothetical protein COA96_04675 [SAR86 cluster bacterium]